MVRASDIEIYYSDPRLRMSVGGRFIVRFMFAVIYLGLAVLTALLLFTSPASDPRMFWMGVLLFFFLAHEAVHLRKGRQSLEYFSLDTRQNAADFFAGEARKIIEAAYDKAMMNGEDFRLMLLLKFFDHREIQNAFQRLEVSVDDLLSMAEREFAEEKLVSKQETLGFIAALAKQAFKRAYENNEPYIYLPDLFGALAELHDKKLDKIFSLFSVSVDDIGNALWIDEGGKQLTPWSPRLLHRRSMNRSWTAKPAPFLDSVSADLTDLARSGRIGTLFGHRKVYERLLDVVARPEQPTALLVGEHGVGKGPILGYLALNIIKDRVPKVLFDKRLIELRLGNLAAGGNVEDTHKRLIKTINEITAAKNIILYIPDIDLLARNEGGTDATIADLFLPIIQQGAFPVIGATDHRAYKQYIEPMGNFRDVFEVIDVPEIDENAAMQYLASVSRAYEKKHKTIITFGAVKSAVQLARKYFHAKPLPGSAEDLLKEALAEAYRLHAGTLDTATIVRIAERKVNIPIHHADKDEAQRLLNLEKTIHERFIDQEEAVSAVSRALRQYRSGLTRKGGPIASFLFLGPTGVGKTELSKILTETQFGSVKLMVRFDMSEFQTKDSIFRFIGSPDGAMTGALTDAIMEKPYSLILLDEFEKAHPDILNLFLQVLDDGRLTDNMGRTADFQNTIIIATSNAHSKFIVDSINEGKEMSYVVSEVERSLTQYFKPELINRFSRVVVFKSLSRKDMAQIASLELQKLAKELAEARGITLTFDASVLQKIAELGYNPTYGARPLRGVIEEKLRSALADLILKGDITKNDSVHASEQNGNFVFQKASRS